MVLLFVATLAAISIQLGTIFGAQILGAIGIKDLRLAFSISNRLSSSLDASICDALSTKLEAVLVEPVSAGLHLITKV